ncbi:MAG: hypothetical protein BWX66_01489 [Deltaproteobacteria bacterium ADurb.Bin058]|nr:MAG: hypothetical protein BWX66_01489 [Deltaproteobacteria bacterium ADurb.Bin058]
MLKLLAWSRLDAMTHVKTVTTKIFNHSVALSRSSHLSSLCQRDLAPLSFTTSTSLETKEPSLKGYHSLHLTSPPPADRPSKTPVLISTIG